jgi:hypothetical protein
LLNDVLATGDVEGVWEEGGKRDVTSVGDFASGGGVEGRVEVDEVGLEDGIAADSVWYLWN